jgi:hypothetical protein
MKIGKPMDTSKKDAKRRAVVVISSTEVWQV